MSEKKKILAVASSGGHWIQLLRLQSAFSEFEVIYVSTYKSNDTKMFGCKYYSVTDASRWDKLKLIKMAFELRAIIKTEKPEYIISTGAAPGLVAIFWGRLNGSKTIWVDSIANAERLSLSGRLVKPLSNLHLTQWKHLAKNKTLFKGTVLS